MSIIYACEKRYIDNEYVHAEVSEKFGTLIQSFKIFCNEMSHTPSILSTIDISTMSVDSLSQSSVLFIFKKETNNASAEFAWGARAVKLPKRWHSTFVSESEDSSSSDTPRIINNKYYWTAVAS